MQKLRSSLPYTLDNFIADAFESREAFDHSRAFPPSLSADMRKYVTPSMNGIYFHAYVCFFGKDWGALGLLSNGQHNRIFRKLGHGDGINVAPEARLGSHSVRSSKMGTLLISSNLCHTRELEQGMRIAYEGVGATTCNRSPEQVALVEGAEKRT
ncbi:hypothetical protein Tco_1057468 [Tanacetum coccineum]|uniref:Uncharacterized protein n=1 Tax=Tanacetum coccineum TaxID=301880 RepID=A0ABQ5H6G1_9ASTR